MLVGLDERRIPLPQRWPHSQISACEPRPSNCAMPFSACADLHAVYRRLVKLTLEELRVIEDHLAQLDQQMADLLGHHHDAVHRLAEVPGLGVDSAQQIIAEVGATAATFPSPKHLATGLFSRIRWRSGGNWGGCGSPSPVCRPTAPREYESRRGYTRRSSPTGRSACALYRVLG